MVVVVPHLRSHLSWRFALFVSTLVLALLLFYHRLDVYQAIYGLEIRSNRRLHLLLSTKEEAYCKKNYNAVFTTH